MKLSRLLPNQSFVYNGRRLKVLRHQGGMTEVVDPMGKLWAWPSVATIKTK